MLNRRGINNLVIILILAIFIFTGSIIAFNSANKAREQREQVRKDDLLTIARVQEDYFDQSRRYSSSIEDLSRFGKISIPSDPVTNKPYMIFVSSSGQEWCAAAQSELIDNQFYTQNNTQSLTINHLPVNVATCK